MKLIVGLGNPGPEYAKTRHNAGFMAIEKLAHRHGLATSGGAVKHKFHAGVLEGRIHLHKVMLMQPMTYMNRSGLAVGEAAAFYKLPPEDVLILVDEIALDVGQIRLRASGGAGGHNGLKDLERALGTRDYPRLRLGIGPNSGGNRVPQVDFVLGKFTDEQLDEMGFTLNKACDCIESWLGDGIELAMTKFNGG